MLVSILLSDLIQLTSPDLSDLCDHTQGLVMNNRKEWGTIEKGTGQEVSWGTEPYLKHEPKGEVFRLKL